VKYFLDTSSLVKIYHKEQGSEIVIDLYNLKQLLYRKSYLRYNIFEIVAWGP
jgi:predicted nucleic acid-binding protein